MIFQIILQAMVSASGSGFVLPQKKSCEIYNVKAHL